MTIKETEQITGLTRSNIRFYEKEKLITPIRNEENGYREYSEEDVKNLKKIAYLRTLGISIEDIRRLVNKEADLLEVVKKQKGILEGQMSELEHAKILCERMLQSGEEIDYADLDVEQYVADPDDYWNKNRSLLKWDSVSFFYLWGGKLVWIIITVVSLLTAAVSFRYLPAEIPVQWSHGMAVSFADRKFVFAFPAACVVIRFLLRPFIWRWLKKNIIDCDMRADYIANYLCFVVLSVELFILLYVKEIVRHVTIVLAADTIVFFGLLWMAFRKKAGDRR
ncbi:MerR family transcriptional regulator [Fusibacillus kribbianus]|uniref:MerR family transcriptional regulator n=1 Tax=Fusibacillus kribbianus TaxID=3044208 RepID=A0AAP4BC82_9FIRM|nr:MerR family transcriptional regulator [Ruminococcus sp. YH-rum2234]MDI9242543.1 MerR family transcriptional regulator [Ruminococcus sp. YH-rum2234]